MDADVRALADDLSRLRAIEREYRMTLRVLAVVVERLLGEGEHVVITDEALADTPDLVAWRDEPRKQVVITVAR
jgi:hypothetical protein